MNERKVYVCHLQDWDFDLMTCALLRCPEPFKGWQLSGYTVNSAMGGGYLDNTQDAELRLVEPTNGTKAKVSADGVKIGPDWREHTQALHTKEEEVGGYQPYSNLHSNASEGHDD